METLYNNTQKWTGTQDGAAIIEFALLFPLLLTMIMGCYDIGRALTINQKVISASQIMADLITRNQSISSDDLQDIILAGQMALDPYDRTESGYDIVSFQFNNRGAPVELWRVTDNMAENDDVYDRSVGLGDEGEGVVAVSIAYNYKPFFSRIFREDIVMREVAILRGRRSATINCADC